MDDSSVLETNGKWSKVRDVGKFADTTHSRHCSATDRVAFPLQLVGPAWPEADKTWRYVQGLKVPEA